MTPSPSFQNKGVEIMISHKQNQPHNLRKIAAQRQLYTDAKRVHLVQYIFSGLALVLISWLGNNIGEEYRVYIVLGALLLAVFDELVINKQLEKLVHLAASIQENFDCEVLDIPHNSIKFIKRDLTEVISKYNDKYLRLHKNYRAITDWYPGMKGSQSVYSKIICMNTNCWWSQEIREKYETTIKSIVTILFIILLLLGIYNGLTIGVFIVSVLSPLIPMFALSYRTLKNNSISIYNLRSAKITIEGIIDSIKNQDSYSFSRFQSDVRCLQDIIYDNRKITILIPDFFYKYFRDDYENTAENTNVELIKAIESYTNND